ncbi:uncharacterized protein HD556DRAFT_1399622 [Suillus plorans]|uniref:BAH domain-containing protein n=1 Tax=Suillus plorans TaxID=116603 RepID=A0A9P7AHX8_9AGAM|nr:uncharacterized protein HD556DRAFT_1399622 [Suillus plorans]KAG1789180.1 hypothetical protein HD556DRAFT_1399622 [Suillus plorans]
MSRRKKKSLFTRKKVSKPKYTIGIPADSEWKTMPDFASFIVADEEGNQHRFSIGETAFILPEGVLPDKLHHPTAYWIGRIKEIRARNDEDVWVLVQWYWSPQEVNSVIKSFDVSGCGQYERIMSDYYDYVSTASFCDHAAVMRYDERSIDQEVFDSDDFFCRFDLEYRARKILPNITRTACCCGVSYNPDRDPVMHFCPRPTCCAAYHQECLQRPTQRLDAAARARKFIESWPDTDEQLSIEDLVGSRPCRKRRKGPESSISDPLEELPEELVKAAQQQIVKGVQAGGVVGNVKAVVAARQLIYRSLLDGSLPTDWKDKVDIEAAIPPKRKSSPVFVCPQCQSLI